MKFNKKWIMILLLPLLVLPGLPAQACVGKTVTVGAVGTPQQEVLAQILAILITERTGTTVKVVALDSPSAAHEALMKAELDMLVEYTGVGQVSVLKKEALSNPSDLYQAVKAGYAQDLNLVWLEPFGFDDPRLAPPGTVAQAAPVVRKDTLKKFPALARLINKLGGAIDTATMKALEDQAANRSPQEIARGFLKEGKLI